MPQKGGRRRKARTHDVGPPAGAAVSATEGEDKTPRSFVFRVGNAHQNVAHLVEDLRRVMEPYTARKLRERANNTVKDYAAVARTFGVTHMLFFSQTEQSLNLRIARSPDGPTLTFKVTEYSLMRHVRAIQKRPVDIPHAFIAPPLVVLNNFGDVAAEPHVKIAKITLQNMFPAINVATVKLADCRRVVLFHLDPKSEEIEMRHYGIRAAPVGINRAVKKIVQAKVPDLRRLDDISEFVTGGGAGLVSDSEAEDEDSKVVLPDRFAGRGNARSQRSAVKLQELGPRLKLRLMKVERGVSSGAVLYHAYLNKTPAEAAAAMRAAEAREALKRKRREEQEENVQRKRQAVEEKKQARVERIKSKKLREEGIQSAAAADADAGAKELQASAEEGDAQQGNEDEQEPPTQAELEDGVLEKEEMAVERDAKRRPAERNASPSRGGPGRGRGGKKAMGRRPTPAAAKRGGAATRSSNRR